MIEFRCNGDSFIPSYYFHPDAGVMCYTCVLGLYDVSFCGKFSREHHHKKAQHTEVGSWIAPHWYIYIYIYGQTPKSDIPPDIAPKIVTPENYLQIYDSSATLIGQLATVTTFGAMLGGIPLSGAYPLTNIIWVPELKIVSV